MDPEAKPVEVTEKSRLISSDNEGGAPQRGDWGATMRLILMGGAGMFADGWDLQVMNLVFAMLKYEYPDMMHPKNVSYIASMTFVGVIVGQFIFGTAGDLFGRKTSSLACAFLTIGGTVASACVTETGPMALASSLALTRFFAGLGIGGEYPLSAAISHEMGTENLVFSKQTLVQINMCMLTTGALVQAIFCYILLAAGCSIENTWRAALGAGAFPSVVAMYFRLQMHEAEPPHPRAERVPSYTGSAAGILFRTLRPNLLGCAFAWGLFGFSAYGQITFLHLILDKLIESDHASVRGHLMNSTIFAIVKCPLTLSGNIICTYILRFGLDIRRVQMSAMMAMACLLWVTCLAQRVNALAAVFFMSTFLMTGFIGITAYSMPALIFPTKVRSSAVGIAAGVGKAGACIGTALFPLIEASAGIVWTLAISGMVLTAAATVTYLTPAAEYAKDMK